ncbi:MAG: orotate phosphoribosyltransferase [Chloroflexi bacterium]|nr:orotate phosphoribosyltransferase [Chloroflexota bacterium]MCH8236208.1 orotate phosphoribosyltransferase [Chloroflexota bacterium]MCH8818109.1 orotate phosphoribosyltransferase [Chloroflexota bacterium]
MADLRALATRILERARELDALRFGDFTLTSGAKSKYYFDGRILTLDPEGADLVSEAFLAMAIEAGVAGVGGPTVAAVPIAGALALRSRQAGTPMDGFFVRDEAKAHGARKRVEGAVKPGTRVVVFDDTVSTGGSLLRAVDAIQDFGCEVAAVLCVLDRHQGGSDEVRRRGVPFRALLEADADGNVAVSDGL